MAPASSLLALVLLPLVPRVLLTEAFLCLRRLALTGPPRSGTVRACQGGPGGKGVALRVSGSC